MYENILYLYSSMLTWQWHLRAEIQEKDTLKQNLLKTNKFRIWLCLVQCTVSHHLCRGSHHDAYLHYHHQSSSLALYSINVPFLDMHPRTWYCGTWYISADNTRENSFSSPFQGRIGLQMILWCGLDTSICSI